MWGGIFLQKTDFAVVGADARQRAAAAYLAQLGYSVGGEEAAAGAGAVLFPAPFDDPALLCRCRPAAGGAAFAGAPSPRVRQAADGAGIPLRDYLADDELAALNAIPTCEGAIGILLARRDRVLWNSRVLVVGFGRIGKLLAQRLAGFGALVTVAARRPAQRALAAALGYRTQDTGLLAETAAGFEILVNTAPAPLVGGAVLARLPRGAFVLDLASAPGGVDLEAAAAAGVEAMRAPGLPATAAPVTAGQFVAKTVLRMMEEMERDE